MTFETLIISILLGTVTAILAVALWLLWKVQDEIIEIHNFIRIQGGSISDIFDYLEKLEKRLDEL